MLFRKSNGVYEIPRDVLKKLDAELHEMKRSKAKVFVVEQVEQMFKEAESGNKEVNIEEQKMH